MQQIMLHICQLAALFYHNYVSLLLYATTEAMFLHRNYVISTLDVNTETKLFNYSMLTQTTLFHYSMLTQK